MNKFYPILSNRKDFISKPDEHCSKFSQQRQKESSSYFGYVLLLFSLLLSTGFGFAQSTANYVFSTNTTSSLGLDANGNAIDLSTGTTPLVSFGSDQGVSALTNIGFNFNLFGNSFSQFSVSANGIMQLGPTVVSGSTYVPSGGSVAAPKFSAIGSDAITALQSDGGGIISKIVGTAPNRCLVVQWVSYLYWLNSTAPATFQVRLYESTGVVEYVYGQMPIGAATYASNFTTGFSVGSLANQLASVTTSTNTISYASFSTNAYAAAMDIPNLHSTAEGNRRSYTFTPPSIVNGDVSNLSFSAVLANGATLNWSDNATNESGFVVTRATDAAFTQNIATFSVASTSSATTGSPYTLVQTGVSAGTTYYYKVVASVEAGLSSGITGTVTTLMGATYYWTGLTGGNWNTFSNWNTAANGSGTAPIVWDNADVYVIDGEGTTMGGALSIVIDRTSFTVGQIKIVGATNLTLASSATATRTITISGGPMDDFILEAGSTLNLTSATNPVAFVFTGSGNSGLIAGSYTASGSTSNLINTTGGSGTSMIVASTGTITSNLNSSSAGFVGSIPTLRFENGSNYVHANSTTVNFIPAATWMPNATATLNGNTTGTSLTSTSTSLGNLVVNTTLSTATFSAFTSASRTIQGNLTVNNTGTGRFRAVTSGVLQVLGNLTINGGTFEVGSSSGGGVIVKGNTTVASGAILDLNQSTLQNEGDLVNNGSILSSESTTANSNLNFLGTTVAQTLSGSGTFTGRIASFGVSNSAGLTVTTPVLTQRVNLFSGTIAGSSNITIGTGLDIAAAVQVGSGANVTPGGSFDVSPTFNVGTGTYTLLYLSETAPRTTGFEVPPSRMVNNVVVNNTNGLTISGGILEVLNTLTLTNGIVNTTLANHIKHGSTTAAGTLSGGSTTSYVNGPLVRTIANGNTSFVLFPVGKTQYAPVSLAPATTDIVVMKAEAFDTNLGSANPSIINLSASRRWETALISGTFTDVKVRVGDASIVSTNIPVQAPSAAGAYTSTFGSTASFSAGTPNVIESTFALPAANFTGFLSFADSNSCVGTPTPGNTIASANAICLGASVTLSLQNTASGSGITYQWKSSMDGVSYTDIAGATSSSLTVTPLMETYYVADVTCTTGPSTGTSTPIHIVFSNTVATTTVGSRCGLGSVNLAATAGAGSTISWYANASGGQALASGEMFTTPAIDATTTYYASAQSATTGSSAIGLGALTSSGVGSSFLSGAWGGVKNQYIIKASELVAAGIAPGAITSLGFEPTTSGQIYTGFSVSMGATTQSAMTTAFITTGLSQVYLGTLANDGFLPVVNTVNTLAFGTGTDSASSFVWDGTSNIVISISKSSVPAASTSTGSVMKYDNAGFVSTAYDQADNLTPAAMLASTVADATSSNRPKFTINGQVLCSSPRIAVIATVSTPPALTISSAMQTICNGSNSNLVTLTSMPADYDTFVWSPTMGVSGDVTTGWVFNPASSTTYTLTATQSAGNLCASTTSITIMVNPLPTELIIAEITPTVCTNTVTTLTATGGAVGVSGKIGSGISSNTSSTPFRGFYGASKTQAIYTAAELTAMGIKAGEKINTIGYVALSGTPIVLNQFTVNVGFIASSNLNGVMNAGATTQVLAPMAYTPSTGVGNLDFPLTTPIIWDGISNLLVETCFNNNDGGGSSSNSISVQSSTVASGLNIYLSLDNTSAACSSTGTPSSTTTRPNLRISTVESATFAWTPITNLFGDAAATVPYVEGTSVTTVYFKSSSAVVANYTVTATTSANCSISAEISVNAVDCAIPYANLQFPGTVTVGTCVSPTYYAQVYKAGVTEAAGQGAGITAWIGKNNANTDPATWSESSWQLATFNVQSGNNDEYQATFAPSAAGTYYVASRFKFAPGAFVYGGYTSTGGGIWDQTTNVSGILTVEAAPAPTASAQTFCNAATVADLMATGTGLQWYDLATGGSALTAATALATGNYYVSQTLNACESARTMVVVTVNVSAAPTASAQTFCNAATVADLMATGTGLQWYDLATGGSALTTGTALVSGNYYVSQTLNACESARTMVAVTLNVTAAPMASAQTFCNVATVADLMATGTGLQWYDLATGGSALTTGTALVSGNYYVSQTLNACESARTMVAVTLNVTAAPTASAQTLCNAGTVADLMATGTELKWYGMATGGFALTAGTALMTGNYYVSQTLNACESARTMVTVTVGSAAAPTGLALQNFTTGQTLGDFVIVGQNIIWYSNATGATVLPASTVIVSGVTYYASQTINGCESTTRLAVTAGIDLKTPSFEMSNLRYYPNPVHDVLTVDYSDTIEKVQMYNMLGQMVYNRNTNASKVTIEMASMIAGNYILQVTVKGITKNVKVIKK